MSETRGLSSEEAERLLAQVGRNELPEDRRGRWFGYFSGLFKEPMLLLLFACAAVYLLIGELREALLLLASAIFVSGLTLFQELRSEQALARLRDLSSPRASVIRDGHEIRIAGGRVVPGDLLVLREGDRVSADGEILQAENLQCDESILTGESLPVGKRPGDPTFSSTLVVSGQGLARVRATGARTELGQIGLSVRSVGPARRTVFQEEAARFVRRAGLFAGGFCLFVIVLYGVQMGQWGDALLAGLATAMAVLPEELPIVVTLFLVMGAWRLSRRSVLTRKMSVIESLGTATVLCVDKTGTLTEGKMRLEALWAETDSDQARNEVLRVAHSANHAVPQDPMERAIEQALMDKSLASLPRERVREYPLMPDFAAILVAWRDSAGLLWVAAKGAPEAVLSLCDLDENRRRSLLDRVHAQAERGQRVLAVAECDWRKELPENRRDFKLHFVGLVCFEDPIRVEVPAALQECRGAGIRVIMMTGDHPGTARAIANQMGLERSDQPVTGDELGEGMDLNPFLKRSNVFARLKPNQKLALVQSLQSQGEVVAMTGDGVNDAPSLKAADIGIAMGGRGTDVARESSDLVLLDDHFASIVHAIRHGRRIYENVRNAMSYLLAIHVPIAGLAMIPVLLKSPLVLLPAQIVLLEFIIDPACSFVFEAEKEDPGIMQRPPRGRAQKLFDSQAFGWALMQGGLVLGLVVAVYLLASDSASHPDHARSLAFTSLIMANLGLIFANRSRSAGLLHLLSRENRHFHWVLGFVAVALILIWQVSWLREMFAFGHLEGPDLLMSVGVGVMAVLIAQFLKILRRRIAT